MSGISCIGRDHGAHVARPISDARLSRWRRKLKAALSDPRAKAFQFSIEDAYGLIVALQDERAHCQSLSDRMAEAQAELFRFRVALQEESERRPTPARPSRRLRTEG